MPRIKRWTPISHDFNRDPEIVSCRKQFGDWIALAWQECLAIGDRNDGIIRGTLDEIALILAPISLQKYQGIAAKTAQNFLKTAEKLGWITIETTHIKIVNYAKYHRTRGPNEAPSEPDLTRPEPNLTIKSDNPPPPAPSADSKSKELNPKIKALADPIYKSDTVKFARLITWIKQAQKKGYPDEIIITALERFAPYSNTVSFTWWAYLDKLVLKARQDWSVAQHDAEHKEIKADESKVLNIRLHDLVK